MMLLGIGRHNAHFILTLGYEIFPGTILIQVYTEYIYIVISRIETEVLFWCVISLSIGRITPNKIM